jgi:isoquinoline 1-oxidoreductase subunit beta
MPPNPWPEEKNLNLDLIAKRLAGQAHSRPAAGPMRRRDFLRITALAGGGLAIAWTTPAALAAGESAHAAAKRPADPSAFVKINPDNTVEIIVNRLDFGQGALTALPMLLAEELDVEWSQVKASLAPAADAYKDPIFGMQMTGGSSAVPNSWMQYREIGAAARTMLVAAAAEQWQVPVSACTTGAGVVHSGTRTATYASLAVAAAKQPVPDKVTLKRPSDYRIIGKGQASHRRGRRRDGKERIWHRCAPARHEGGRAAACADLRRPGSKL